VLADLLAPEGVHRREREPHVDGHIEVGSLVPVEDQTDRLAGRLAVEQHGAADEGAGRQLEALLAGRGLDLEAHRPRRRAADVELDATAGDREGRDAVGAGDLRVDDQVACGRDDRGAGRGRAVGEHDERTQRSGGVATRRHRCRRAAGLTRGRRDLGRICEWLDREVRVGQWEGESVWSGSGRCLRARIVFRAAAEPCGEQRDNDERRSEEDQRDARPARAHGTIRTSAVCLDTTTAGAERFGVASGDRASELFDRATGASGQFSRTM
jgi:hypothetical protein